MKDDSEDKAEEAGYTVAEIILDVVLYLFVGPLLFVGIIMLATQGTGWFVSLWQWFIGLFS